MAPLHWSLVHHSIISYVRQLSKPVAATIKSSVIEHPVLRGIIVRAAQSFHRLDLRIRLRWQGAKATNIKPLSEAKALQTGADVFSELFVYGIASTVLLYEYKRSSEKEANKDRQLAEALNEIAERVEQLHLELDIIKWERAVAHGKKQSDDEKPDEQTYGARPTLDEEMTLPRIEEEEGGWLNWLPFVGSKATVKQEGGPTSKSTSAPSESEAVRDTPSFNPSFIPVFTPAEARARAEAAKAAKEGSSSTNKPNEQIAQVQSILKRPTQRFVAASTTAVGANGEEIPRTHAPLKTTNLVAESLAKKSRELKGE
ncbi:hypothetical protein SARC_03081 [Sphaeroforma arctica JP610]|uniref:OPA3-like protein n=1 Tax=Sphaeroforma arctica JP610 TaxID=667725 RepID=A0A0L0G6R2_9EUKA|nr:hypothetical protein SARC_03081 [Sphaeroforma arctica JP610]KNC84707.1 hypothetical protein SARC_03081 [Sphaeroforma arctica JP610]|eukprot:XP_014158609.1 hypothetical protein SARC_03081 [Sphaeroforma arctica JP610]